VTTLRMIAHRAIGRFINEGFCIVREPSEVTEHYVYAPHVRSAIVQYVARSPLQSNRTSRRPHRRLRYIRQGRISTGLPVHPVLIPSPPESLFAGRL